MCLSVLMSSLWHSLRRIVATTPRTLCHQDQGAATVTAIALAIALALSDTAASTCLCVAISVV